MDSGTPVSRPEPRWRRRKDARPTEILAAALESFFERGYESSRLEDIAKRAGCTKGTIFLYYESKAELFKAVIRDVMLPLIQEGEQLVEAHGGTCRELLEKLLRLRWERAQASRMSALAKLLFAETNKYPELARFYHEEIHLKSQAVLQRAFELGVRCGEFRALGAVSVARIAIAPIILAGIWRQSFGPAIEALLDTEAHFATTLDVLFSGIALAPVPRPDSV